VHVSRVDFALNDIQNGDITSSFAWSREYHTILGLEETPHNVEDGRSPYGLGFVNLIAGEGCIRSH